MTLKYINSVMGGLNPPMTDEGVEAVAFHAAWRANSG